MAAVNLQLMAANVPFDFLPNVHLHSRSNSVSSTSSHSPSSRPQSSQGGVLRASALMPPSSEDLYRASFHTTNSFVDSPPNHNITNPALKGHLRPTHIRARVSASPYPRDTESVHSSSSETEDISMYLSSTGADYHNMFVQGQQAIVSNPEAMHAAGAFGRMTLSPDHALEKLAANVRAATTTSASDRAKQIFVQAWLTANYSPYPDGNVPRQGLYFSYRRVCDQYGIPHINTATLGKAIRLCFPTIKTRRLGVRGNSKYHSAGMTDCGIRPATSAEAEFLQDYIRKSNNNAAQQSVNAARMASEQAETMNRGGSDEDDEDESEGPGSGNASKRNSLNLSNGVKNPALFADEKTPTAASLLAQAQATQRPPGSTFPVQAPIRRHTGQEGGLPVPSQSSPSSSMPTSIGFMGAGQSISVRHMANFPSIDEAVGAGSTSPQGAAAREVWRWFQDHLDALLDSIRSFRFDQFELHLRTFWSSLNGAHREVVHAPAVAGLMAKADAIVYDEILELLRSQMLSPIPPASLAGLRQLADKMEKILLVALDSYGQTFVEPKVELGARFGHLVLRFLDIYQVTQALSTVLTNQKQLMEMRRSWQKVDFESVRNQSALVCNCRHEDLVQLLEVEFVSVLEGLGKSADPVRDVMAWADKCCERLMGGRGNAGDDRATMSSRSVLIRWGYVTSQVMRDLTIRSDPAFGAFQILKLFLDDWIALNVLRNVALSTNSVAASVEPVMQQQFFTLSPMPGQESFGNPLDVRPHPVMAHTPTTSSMLAALQADNFGGSLDPTSTAFGSDAFGSLSYMDTTSPQDDLPVHSSALTFPDYVSGSSAFDVAAFTPQDLGISASGTPPSASSESDNNEPETVKSET
ncbi:Transcription factor RFX3 [Grifola frondosa]|uniref:Transcription factor RFX3 n=1 Tax=Grifola frondosa TaxID=5627 RepID=A0A1C7MI97_GRIFR|nr:Transcription factor RFX3 [Grifola frondosa]